MKRLTPLVETTDSFNQRRETFHPPEVVLPVCD
jgi:hypothetical protein